MEDVEGHSPLGPSGAYRWTQCTMSPHLLRQNPRPSSSYADEGTMLHEIAAARLGNLTGRTRSEEENLALINRWRALTREQRDVIDDYTNVVRDILLDEVYPRGSVSQVTFKIEHPISARHLHPLFRGTADCIIMSPEPPGQMYVIDFKAGGGVSVETRTADGRLNLQLAMYLLGALETIGAAVTPERIYPVIPELQLPRHIEVVVVQPRAGGVKREHVTLLELEDLALELVEAAYKVENAPEYKPGEWCRFCAKGACTAYRDAAATAAQIEFGPIVPATPSAPKEGFRTHEPATIPTDMLQRYLSALPMLEDWIAGIKDEANRRAMRGETIPGYKLVGREGHRKWENEAEALTVLAKCVPRADLIEEPSLKSPAQVEKVLKRYKAAPTIVDTLTVRPTLGAILVPEGDKRPALTKASPEEDFTVIP